MIINNSSKKYSKFPIWVHSVQYYYKIKKYVTANQILKYTTEPQLLQYASHIRKFWFMILLEFSEILNMEVKIWFMNHESWIVKLNVA